MFIVMVRFGGQRAGCLVGFGRQASIAPPRFLIRLSRKNHTYRLAAGAELIAVHVVPQDADPLARLFGSRCSGEMDKFARCAWLPGPGEVPILQDCGTGSWGSAQRFDPATTSASCSTRSRPSKPASRTSRSTRPKGIEPVHLL